MTDKRTFTQLLLREIRAHFELLATDPQRSACERDAFYTASREIGRNTPRFVQEARRKMEWQDIATEHQEAANGR